MALVLGLVTVVLGAPTPPAAAAPRPLSLAVVPGGGMLVLRDSEAPTTLGQPTTIAGTVEDGTGVLTGGTFVAPPVEYSFGITTPVVATVFVEATFSEVVPGSVEVTVGEDDSVAVAMTVKADLHIEIPPFLTADCAASPISLLLRSTAPFDRSTGRVTLRDDDFSVPTVPTSGTCPSIVQAEVNETLAGDGHALELRMQGDVPPVVGVGDPTSTTLSVSPGSSRPGAEVTLSAAVVPHAGGVVPTGVVEFLDGPSAIGRAALDGGVATFATRGLGAGLHQLRARYLGDGALFSRSASGAVTHLVAVAPEVDLDMADTVLYGGRARPITVTVTNAGELGAPVAHARLDLTLARAASQNLYDPGQLLLERLDGGTWERVPLTYDTAARRGVGSVGTATGFPLAAGEVVTVRMRLTMPEPVTAAVPTSCGAGSPPCPGPWDLTATLVEVDEAGAVTGELAGAAGRFTLIEQTRRPTTLTVNGGAPRPHTVRQGYSVEVIVIAGPAIGAVTPTGFAEVHLDGRPVPARTPGMPFDLGYRDQIPMGAGNVVGQILLPPDIEEGTHRITVRYLGDLLFAPAEVTTTFTVLPSAGHPFVCRAPNLNGQNEYGINVTFEAGAPASAVAGSTVPLDLGAVRYAMGRPGIVNVWPTLGNDQTATVGVGLLDGISFGLGGGSGAATTVTRTGGVAMPASPNPADPSQVDQVISFGGATAAVVVDGRPGDVVPVTLEEIEVDFHLSSPPIPITHRCTPVGDAPVLQEVEVAGVAVSASPERAREGADVVAVEARVFPAAAAGSVTFASDLDGTLGTAAVSGGVASWSAGGLRPGAHVITAAFDADDPGVPDSVGTVGVRVSYSPRTATERFVVAARTDYLGSADRADVVADAAALDGGRSRGAYLAALSRSEAYLGRVVDGMYRDTLGRPGDEAGVTFWIGRLEAGWSVARVAASFYSSDEYHRRVGGTDEAWVRDLYDVLLGRGADEAGLAHWVAEIPRRGRDQVAHRFFQTPESARARVVASYERFLGRRPGVADRDFWAARVVARGDLVLAVELTLSSEYGRRAGTRFPIV